MARAKKTDAQASLKGLCLLVAGVLLLGLLTCLAAVAVPVLVLVDALGDQPPVQQATLVSVGQCFDARAAEPPHPAYCEIVLREANGKKSLSTIDGKRADMPPVGSTIYDGTHTSREDAEHAAFWSRTCIVGIAVLWIACLAVLAVDFYRSLRS